MFFRCGCFDECGAATKSNSLFFFISLSFFLFALSILSCLLPEDISNPRPGTSVFELVCIMGGVSCG